MTALQDAYMSIVAITTSTVSAASVYFVMDKIDFPEAKLFAMVIFVITMVKSWGNEEIKE